jgi:hypothetical protein
MPFLFFLEAMMILSEWRPAIVAPAKMFEGPGLVP